MTTFAFRYVSYLFYGSGPLKELFPEKKEFKKFLREICPCAVFILLTRCSDWPMVRKTGQCILSLIRIPDQVGFVIGKICIKLLFCLHSAYDCPVDMFYS